MSRGNTGPRIWIATAIAVATAVIAAGCGGGGGIESSGSGPAGQVDASGPVQGKLTISQWPLYIDPGKNGTIAEFEGKTGVDVNYIEDINDNNQFFGKLQPQLAKGQSGGRRPDHPQRLAGEADVRPRLPPEARLLEAAERQAQPDPGPAPSDRGPESRIHRPLAERDDGADRPHRPGAGRELDLRPVRPEVQGQGRHAHRAARHGADDPEVHGHRSRSRPPRPSGSPPSTRSRTRPTRARSGASPATTTSATSARATSTSSSAGPATRSRCRRTTRTSSS